MPIGIIAGPVFNLHASKKSRLSAVTPTPEIILKYICLLTLYSYICVYLKTSQNMTTLEKIIFDGVGVLEKAGRGETLTTDDKIILKAYTTLNSGKSGRAGKVANKTRLKNN